MQLDITLSLIFKEVQEEIKEEYGEELSIEEIGDIVESQFHILMLGINLEAGTRIPVFGSFYKLDYSKNLERGRALAAKKDSMTKEEYKEALTKIKLISRAETLADNKKRAKALSIEDLLEVEITSSVMGRYKNILLEYKNFKDEQEE